MTVERVAAADRLRIAVLGNFESVHTRSWLRWFVERGHEVHAISYYLPVAELNGVRLHVLHPGFAPSVSSTRRAAAPSGGRGRSIMRLAHAMRYRTAGLSRVLDEIRPDVFHSHFLVEHGFYGSLAGFHPYVVTTWGSDVLVEPARDRVSRLIARWVLSRADLVTSNNGHMAERIIALGCRPSKVEVVTLGADVYFLERHGESVNVRPQPGERAPVVLSTRAHEPLYNIGDIIEAYGLLLSDRPDARLVVANSGSLTARLQARARQAGGRVEFVGFLDRERFRDALADAELFVSVPTSDGTSVALLQAMAAGCFPVVSDLPTQRELVEDGVNGFRVPAGRPDLLAARLNDALTNGELRRAAAERNRRIVEERGLNETQMARMESLYRRLAGR